MEICSKQRIFGFQFIPYLQICPSFSANQVGKEQWEDTPTHTQMLLMSITSLSWKLDSWKLSCKSMSSRNVGGIVTLCRIYVAQVGRDLWIMAVRSKKDHLNFPQNTPMVHSTGVQLYVTKCIHASVNKAVSQVTLISRTNMQLMLTRFILSTRPSTYCSWRLRWCKATTTNPISFARDHLTGTTNEEC